MYRFEKTVEVKPDSWTSDGPMRKEGEDVPDFLIDVEGDVRNYLDNPIRVTVIVEEIVPKEPEPRILMDVDGDIWARLPYDDDDDDDAVYSCAAPGGADSMTLDELLDCSELLPLDVIL